jgi:tricorn protease
MWHGTTVYYLSDGGTEGRLNVWAYDINARMRRQVTYFKDFDIKWPSIGAGLNGKGEIVFNYGTDLFLVRRSYKK